MYHSQIFDSNTLLTRIRCQLNYSIGTVKKLRLLNVTFYEVISEEIVRLSEAGRM